MYRFLLKHLLFPLADKLLGVAFMSTLKKWRAIEKQTPAEVAALQQKHLRRLLEYAVTNIPYYKSLSIAQSPDPAAWLRAFPVMHKDDIRNNLDSLLGQKKEDLVCERSSGSSGVQGEVYMSRQEQFAATATQTYLWEWSGYRLGQPLLQLGMTTQRSRLKYWKDRVLRTSYQQAFHISKVVAAEALGKFRGKHGAFFGGYASGLYAYACAAEEAGITDVRFESVISWGDKMFPHYRSKIESQFHTRVFDTYGTTEGFMMAGQCEHGNYHILTPHVHLELLDKEGNEVAPGELGYVVVTRLDAYAMPLIRYYLGDLAIKKDPSETCACGRPFPMLQQIIGRDTDIVRTPAGQPLIVHFFTGIFEHVPEIRQFRVVQHSLDGIEIEYIPAASFREAVLDEVAGKIKGYIEGPFAIQFRRVQEIPPTPSGKPQIIQSTVAKA